MFFIILASLFALSFSAPECTPSQSGFYWKSPCDGQTFKNRVLVNDLNATQAGKPVDDKGGLDVSINLDLLAAVEDQYGTMEKPLVDIAIQAYTKNSAGKCTWKKVPTFGIMDNIDACKVLENCHLTGDPKSLVAKVDFKDLAGPFYDGILVNTYYGLSLTFKDSKQPVFCVYAQDVVIKK